MFSCRKIYFLLKKFKLILLFTLFIVFTSCSLLPYSVSCFPFFFLNSDHPDHVIDSSITYQKHAQQHQNQSDNTLRKNVTDEPTLECPTHLKLGQVPFPINKDSPITSSLHSQKKYTGGNENNNEYTNIESTILDQQAIVYFKTGMSLLHSFWYDLAQICFQKAVSQALSAKQNELHYQIENNNIDESTTLLSPHLDDPINSTIDNDKSNNKNNKNTYNNNKSRFNVDHNNVVNSFLAMSYWGQAMSNIEILWHGENNTAANLALQKITKDMFTKLSESEKSYIKATTALFNHTLTPQERIKTFQTIFSSLTHQQDDVDTTAFLGLSTLSLSTLVSSTDQKTKLIQQSRDILGKALKTSPRHPGLLHYWIHAHDFPDIPTAQLARQEGILYAEIASGSSHAVHMITHVFVNTGEWKLLTDYNILSLKAADDYCGTRFPECNADNRYHALEWVHYGLLMRGQLGKAHDYLIRMKTIYDHHRDSNMFSLWYSRMRARHIYALLFPNEHDLFVNLPDEREELRMIKDEIDEKLPTIPSPEEDLYWSLFSESGNIVSQALFNNATQSNPGTTQDFQTWYEKLNKLESQSKSTDAYVHSLVEIDHIMLQAIESKNKCEHFISSIAETSQHFDHLNTTSTASCFKSWTSLLNQAIDISSNSPKMADSPTLPIIPVHELYGMWLISHYKQSKQHLTQQDDSNVLLELAQSLFEKSIYLWAPRRQSVLGLYSCLVFQGKNEEAKHVWSRHGSLIDL